MPRPALVLLVLAAVGCTATPPQPVLEKSSATVLEAAVMVTPFAPLATPLHVLIGGDLIPHRPSLAAPAALTHALAPLGPLFGSVDMVVANYEAATGELDKKAFRLAYAAPPAWLAALPAAGIKAVSVANNHACDLGHEGVEATLDAAQKADITAIGGDAKGEAWAPRTLVERDGKRVCAVAWTTLVNAEGGCARTARLAIASENAAGRQKIAAALQRAKSECDATVAIIHGGEEYAAQTSSMMAVARRAADAGADAVVLHHPHIASPVVVHLTKDGRSIPIFASVGNLVSNQGESWKPSMFPVMRENRRLVCVNGWTRLGVLADLAFSFGSGDQRPRLDWGFHLVWTENEHADDKAKTTPAIATRLFDPKTDGELMAKLEEDTLGPTDLFDDPCWRERPVYNDGDLASSARCSTSLVRGKNVGPDRSLRRADRQRRK